MNKLWKVFKTVFWTFVIQHSDKAKLYTELKRLQYNVNQYLYAKEPKYKGDFYIAIGICGNVQQRQVSASLASYFANWPEVYFSTIINTPNIAYPLGYDEWEKYRYDRWQNPKRVELLNWLIETIDTELNEELENRVG